MFHMAEDTGFSMFCRVHIQLFCLKIRKDTHRSTKTPEDAFREKLDVCAIHITLLNLNLS